MIVPARVRTGSRKSWMFLNLIISFETSSTPECSWIFTECSWMFLNPFIARNFFFALFIPRSNVPETITTSEEKQRSLSVGYHRWRTDRVLKLFFGWNNVLENVQNPPTKIRSWISSHVFCTNPGPRITEARWAGEVGRQTREDGPGGGADRGRSSQSATRDLDLSHSGPLPDVPTAVRPVTVQIVSPVLYLMYLQQYAPSLCR